MPFITKRNSVGVTTPAISELDAVRNKSMETISIEQVDKKLDIKVNYLQSVDQDFKNHIIEYSRDFSRKESYCGNFFYRFPVLKKLYSHILDHCGSSHIEDISFSDITLTTSHLNRDSEFTNSERVTKITETFSIFMKIKEAKITLIDGSTFNMDLFFEYPFYLDLSAENYVSIHSIGIGNVAQTLLDKKNLSLTDRYKFILEGIKKDREMYAHCHSSNFINGPISVTAAFHGSLLEIDHLYSSHVKSFINTSLDLKLKKDQIEYQLFFNTIGEQKAVSFMIQSEFKLYNRIVEQDVPISSKMFTDNVQLTFPTEEAQGYPLYMEMFNIMKNTSSMLENVKNKTGENFFNYDSLVSALLSLTKEEQKLFTYTFHHLLYDYITIPNAFGKTKIDTNRDEKKMFERKKTCLGIKMQKEVKMLYMSYDYKNSDSEQLKVNNLSTTWNIIVDKYFNNYSCNQNYFARKDLKLKIENYVMLLNTLSDSVLQSMNLALVYEFLQRYYYISNGGKILLDSCMVKFYGETVEKWFKEGKKGMKSVMKSVRSESSLFDYDEKRFTRLSKKVSTVL